jgi:flagellar hook-associated protein 2
MSTITTTGVNGTANSESSLLQQAAQSILSGLTNSTLDVNSLVSSLVTAKTAGQQQTITNAISSDNTTLSALGSMQSALSSVLSALAGQTSTTGQAGSLVDGTIFKSLSATLSGSGITASTTTSAAAGTYSINVTQIATANQISSKAYASGATLGTGTLTIGVGSSSMSITLDSTNNTLQGVANAINNSSSNPGVTASVVTGTDGQHLVLTSTQTGAANTVTVSGSSGVDSGMATANFTQVTTAQDAKLTISGTAVDSASNTITNALTGVNLALTSASVGTTQTLTIAQNTTAISNQIQSFVTAYNQWISTESSLSSFNASAAQGSQAGPLLGDAMLNSAVNGIASIMSAGITVGGATYDLAQIGINLNHDGTLSLDTSKLNSTLATSPSTVSAIFNGTNGFGEQLNSFISSYTNSVTGQISQREASLNADLAAQSQAQTSLTAWEQTLTAQYQAQFTQLNTLMAQTTNETSYLNRLFGGGGLSGSLNSK